MDKIDYMFSTEPNTISDRFKTEHEQLYSQFKRNIDISEKDDLEVYPIVFLCKAPANKDDAFIRIPTDK